MHKESYNLRLREIREKYGPSVKDTTSCIRSNDKPTVRGNSNYDDRPTTLRKQLESANDKKYTQRNDPTFTNLSSKYSSSILKENDSFLQTQNKDERLKEIEKIRKEFAQSRKKAVDDFNRVLQKSKSKYLETQKHGVLKERVNISSYNPEDLKAAPKETLKTENYRGRAQSSYNSTRVGPDLQLNRELKRNYDYNEEVSTVRGNRAYDNPDPRPTTSYRNNSVSRFDRENTVPAGFAQTDNFKSVQKIDSQTTSPIRGLMKFDSVEKPRKTETAESQFVVSKLSANNYDLTNIDRIQERIHKILGKK